MATARGRTESDPAQGAGDLSGRIRRSIMTVGQIIGDRCKSTGG
jgi:hypothetical protein